MTEPSVDFITAAVELDVHPAEPPADTEPEPDVPADTTTPEEPS
jgi:hypothetical protein